MASVYLDRLPSELIAQIAVSCSATSALSLAATCRRVRSASYEAFVFRNILELSHEEHWAGAPFDIDAVAHRCGRDASTWARYAVADEKAYMAVYQNTTSVHISQHVLAWAPALSMVKHPFMYSSWWAGRVAHPERSFPSLPMSARWEGPHSISVGSSDGVLSKPMWCTSVATLARESASDDLVEQYRTHALQAFMDGQSLTGYLHGLCSTIIGIRLLRRQMEASNPDRMARHITIPKISSLDLGSHETLPLPFETNLDQWHSWVKDQSEHLLGKMTSGTWQGYYMHIGSGELDEPMLDIRFQQVYSDTEDTSVIAQDAWDRVGHFKVEGNFHLQEQTFHFGGSKKYYRPGNPNSTRFGWNWSLKLTPFGLIGYWGTLGDESSRLGTVWLWKQD